MHTETSCLIVITTEDNSQTALEGSLSTSDLVWAAWGSKGQADIREIVETT